MDNFKHYPHFTGSNPEKYFKSTLFSSTNLLLGLNCLEPGQRQDVHAHGDQDKFYFVVEGEGKFKVGEDEQTVNAGWTVWAPAGATHGVLNTGDQRLVILVGIAPAP